MSILKIALMGHPILRQKARIIDRLEVKSPAIQRLIDDMIETMVEYRGAGLAAPQVHVDFRLFVALSDVEGNSAPLVLVNPEVTAIGKDIAEDWEGCLSIPEVHGKVLRAREVAVQALGRNGEQVQFQAQDFAARVIQHEYDHVNGVLFIDRMKSLESLTFASMIEATSLVL